MKKVLILTASTGEGHNAAAKSLENKFRLGGYETKTMDLFKETSRALNAVVEDGYRVLANRFPSLYGFMYRALNRKSINHRFLRYSLFIIKHRLYETIKELEPSIIVGTHPFAVGMISDLKSRGKINASFFSVVTDFKPHYAYISPEVDVYITGSDYTTNSLIEMGIPPEKIHAYGIPVKDEFQSFHPKTPEFLKLIEEFKVLVMGGSMGSKDIAKVVQALTEASKTYHLIVVCGRNEALRVMLKDNYRSVIDSGKLEVFGFTRNVSELMDSADVIVTKPGGLTTTEALSKRIPMIIPFAIPGQEFENTEFLIEMGAAIYVDDIDQIGTELERLRKDKTLYLSMIESMDNISRHYSTEKIVDLADQLLIKNELMA
jgi:processive 1,2-diacylglycerol beta-glucosyltransferase